MEFKLNSIADEETIEVEADEGDTLLDVCQNEGVDITGSVPAPLSCIAVCGGGGSCGSCNVILPQELFDAVPPMKDQEKELLETVVFGRKPT